MKIRFEEYLTVKQDIDSRNVGKHRSRDVRNVKKEKCLDQISTRDYRVNGRCMAIWSIVVDVLRCLFKEGCIE